MLNFLRKYIFSILLSVVILSLSVIDFSDVKVPEEIPLTDKLVHFIMYAVLSFTLLYDLTRSSVVRRCSLKHILISFSLASVVGGILELVQHYCTVSRSGDIMDAVANTIGAAIGVIVGALIIPYVINVYYKISGKEY